MRRPIKRVKEPTLLKNTITFKLGDIGDFRIKNNEYSKRYCDAAYGKGNYDPSPLNRHSGEGAYRVSRNGGGIGTADTIEECYAIIEKYIKGTVKESIMTLKTKLSQMEDMEHIVNNTSEWLHLYRVQEKDV